MKKRQRAYLQTVLTTSCTLTIAFSAMATGVPISGFYPLAGISLTTKHDTDSDPTFTFFQADYETSYLGTPLSTSGTPYFEVALVDTGAAATLITSAADSGFNIAGAGYRGTHDLPLGGATGSLVAITNDPMAIYASGLGPSNRTSTSPLTLNTGLMVGQSSVSLATLPPESDLPNVLGIPFSSQYATYIRNDQPQIFSLGGKTVRTPQIQFMTLGSGGQGIVRRVPITLDDNAAFTSPPLYVPDIETNLNNGTPLTDNPSAPTVRVGSNNQPSAAYFLNVNVANKGNSLSNTSFLLDTGADISVVSQINAVNLGFDPILDTPDFTESVIGSGGTLQSVPGFYVDQLTIPAVGGTITLTHVPFIVLDFPNPSHIGNVAQGLIGMNALAGRNIVIDPNPATGGGGNSPSLYISDPVTTSHDWSSTAASGTWGTAGNWNASGTPSALWIANVRNVSGSPQSVLVGNSQVWEVNVSGTGAATMNLQIGNTATLTTFSGANIEAGGKIELQNGTLDAQYVDIRGGTLAGYGRIAVGSGPIVGQVENHSGSIAPSGPGAVPAFGTIRIAGRLANDGAGTIAIDIGGQTIFDFIVVDNDATLEGTLMVSLINAGGGTYSPTVGTVFPILTATGGIGGTFDHVIGPDGYNWRVNYLANSVQLVVGNPGDFNNDGTVDGQDYVVWRKNALGPLNLLAWRSHFGATYSGSGASLNASVPEPSSLFLAMLAACGLTLSRKLPISRARS